MTAWKRLLKFCNKDTSDSNTVLFQALLNLRNSLPHWGGGWLTQSRLALVMNCNVSILKISGKWSKIEKVRYLRLEFLMSLSRKMRSGFTLAELLIAVAILGVIATFTIPKIIAAQTNGTYNAKAHDVAGMISGAYQQAQLNGAISSSSTAGVLSQYINYVSVDNTSLIDNMNGATTNDCSSDGLCLNLHNGGKLLLWKYSFGGTATTNVLMFQFDPDGVVTDGTTNGPGKAVKFALYYNGKLTTRAQSLPGTADSFATYPSSPNADPSWFQW